MSFIHYVVMCGEAFGHSRKTHKHRHKTVDTCYFHRFNLHLNIYQQHTILKCKPSRPKTPQQTISILYLFRHTSTIRVLYERNLSCAHIIWLQFGLKVLTEDMQLDLIRCRFANAIVCCTNIGATLVSVHVLDDQGAGYGAFFTCEIGEKKQNKIHIYRVHIVQ